MKNIILTTLLFLLLVGNLCFGQNSWSVLLPENGEAIKMIKASDGNYVMLFMNYVDSVSRIYKYNNNGEMIWKSEQDFFYATDQNMIELSTGELIMSGNQDELPFIMVLNADGHLIAKKKYEEFEKYSRINNIAETFDNNLFAFIGNYYYPTQLDTLYRIDKKGEIIEERHDVLNSPNCSFYKTNSGFITAGSYPKSYTYSLFDSSMNAFNQKLYSFWPFHVRETKSGFIVHDYYYNIFDAGLVMLDANLDSLWSVPFSHYHSYDFIDQTPSAFTICNDGGFAMSGSYIDMGRTATYLIKTDSIGNPIIAQDYWFFSPSHTTSVVEADDGGFVLFQYYAEPGQRYNFLVHTNLDGTVNINDNEFSQKEDIVVFPNPAFDFINVRLEKNQPIEGPIIIYDINGRVVTSVTKGLSDNEKINIQDLRSGLYIVQVINSKKQYTGKFIKC